MNKKRYIAKSYVLAGSLMLGGFFAGQSVYAASSYLQELEAEAAATGEDSGSSSTKEDKPDWSKQQTGTGETIDKGLSKTQFEEALKTRFYGSYLFYSTLDDTKQGVVYKEYKNDNHIEYLREVIKAQMTN